jgi:HptB-dependent secretion and biofilm anti anti-sigma factor
MEIHIDESQEQPTIALKGRFDFQTHQQFQNVVSQLLQNGNARLKVDLSEVNFIDSFALGVLLAAREDCTKAGGAVALERPQVYVGKVLKLCQFDQLFEITY